MTTTKTSPHKRQSELPGKLFSLSLNRRSENVIVEVIIVPELELCNVKVQVLLTLLNVPTIPRLMMGPKPSIVLVCTEPTTYSFQVQVHRHCEERERRSNPDCMWQG
jgi:hypothetical protein